MPNTTSGPAVGTQKETVYGGPAPTGNAGGTVYNGPTAGGTVYQGPGLNNAAADNSRMAQMIRATQQAGRDKGGKIFFIIAGFSALNTLLITVKAPFTMAIGLSVTRISLDEHLGVVLLINVIAIGLFAGLGSAVTKGSKAAFITGMVLYTVDTALLLFTPDAAAHMVPLIVHAIFLYSMVKTIRQIV